MRVCSKCGTEVTKRFCPDCGTEYVEPMEAVDTAEPVEEAEDDAYVKPAEPVEAEAVDVHGEEPEVSYEVRQEIVPVPNTQREYTYQEKPKTSGFSAKSTAIVAYIGWIGLIIAFILGDREGGKFHLNQALVIYLASIIIGFAGSFVPFLGGLIVFVGSIFCFVCWGLGLYYAITNQEKEVPVIGQIRLL